MASCTNELTSFHNTSVSGNHDDSQQVYYQINVACKYVFYDLKQMHGSDTGL